jgi:hypothetical protein
MVTGKFTITIFLGACNTEIVFESNPKISAAQLKRNIMLSNGLGKSFNGISVALLIKKSVINFGCKRTEFLNIEQITKP